MNIESHMPRMRLAGIKKYPPELAKHYLISENVIITSGYRLASLYAIPRNIYYVLRI